MTRTLSFLLAASGLAMLTACGGPTDDETSSTASGSPKSSPSGEPAPSGPTHVYTPPTPAPDSGASAPDSSASASDSGSGSPDSAGASSDAGDGSLGSAIAAIAMANVGLGACSTNSEGGTAYETSCDGNGGEPEYWCADFAQWVWQQAGANTDGLDAAASTFYLYGQTNGTLHTRPSIGDAVVFNYMDDYAEHVALVVAIESDGSIETVSGDWDGTGSTEAAFASTSRVVLNVPSYPGVTGSAPTTMGMTLSAFVSPVPTGSGGTVSGPPECIVSSSGQQGTCIDTSTCASTGGASTPGYCPGPDDEECCIATK